VVEMCGIRVMAVSFSWKCVCGGWIKRQEVLGYGRCGFGFGCVSVN
jgi:hypothetical protein